MWVVEDPLHDGGGDVFLALGYLVGIAALVSLTAILLAGLPLYLYLSSRGQVTWLMAGLCGAFLGMLVAILMSFAGSGGNQWLPNLSILAGCALSGIGAAMLFLRVAEGR